MNWTFARGLVYLACLVASGLAMAGLADFDLATGTFDLRPFNLYALTGAAGGVVSSALASIALCRSPRLAPCRTRRWPPPTLPQAWAAGV